MVGLRFTRVLFLSLIEGGSSRTAGWGDTEFVVLVVDEVDKIDASFTDMEFLGHSISIRSYSICAACSEKDCRRRKDQSWNGIMSVGGCTGC